MSKVSARYSRLGADRWRELAARQRASGEAVTSFCARRGLSRSTFDRWRRKADAESC
jgi:hypothetical protein